MIHPDSDRLTSWVHGFLDAADAAEVEGHVSDCAECHEAAAGLRDEARVLSNEIASPERLAALKAGLLLAAGRRRPLRQLLWQIPVAAAVLVGLVAVLLSPGSRHSLVEGRVALEDGSVVSAPADLAAARTWTLRALEKSSVRLSDRSTVDLGPGTRIGLAADGPRGVQADLLSGEASFVVAPDPKRLVIVSPAGRVEAVDGKFSVKIVFEKEGGVPMKKVLAGAIVTVFAGSISLSNANGNVNAVQGQSAVLAQTEAPLLVSAPQDQQEDLLRRLEQLAARVAKLEEEVGRLEQKNKQLKLQVSSNAPGGAVWSTNGAGGVRILQSAAGQTPGSSVIIELDENNGRKPEKKNPQEK
jgi:anti-sigma factor RsiW